MSDKKNQGFFENYRYCKDCMKLLPSEYEFDLCPTCIEQRLFREVRDYIRANDVTEYDVADKFQIPVRRVKAWIREGRIEYQKTEDKKIVGSRCARCGEPIMIGDFCPRCIKYMQAPKARLKGEFENIDASRMRFLDDKKS
ncbi:MAG: hypothetical protein K6A30_01100 [Lachnospiraceae bacterium]|nr:hypothetical protein [Lachnospiraceae bacterium]